MSTTIFADQVQTDPATAPRAPRMFRPVRLTAEQRLSLHLDTAGDCWVFTGALNHNGYGILWTASGMMRAHRLAYETWVGPIPPGLHIDHLCRNRACCRPEHPEAVPQAINNQRAAAARRGVLAVAA